VLKRVLFVDDDKNLLMGLQRSLRSMRSEWEMAFVGSGDEALEAMDQLPFDMLVTDMRMPGMSGAELLEKVKERFPQTVRIILSGHADRDSIVRASASAHQMLSKPFDPEKLKLQLSRTVALTSYLQNSSLKKFVSRMKCIPSLPSNYHEVILELRSEDPSPARIGSIIGRDLGMTSKILQLVNSAVSGISVEISEPTQAVMLLGLDTIQAMVLSVSIFSAFDLSTLRTGEAEQLWRHSLSISKLSRSIAQAHGVDGSALDPYQSAGLLHDIGKLMMASADPKRYRAVLDHTVAHGAELWLAEREVFGCSHAEIGAYLLGIWGLPAAIVEAVAWHHCPSESPVTEFSPLAAVHFADGVDAETRNSSMHGSAALDHEFLDRIGLPDLQEEWLRGCQAHILESGVL
jgi:putative nucleotidyltransferase with HDIG domain